MIKKYGKKFLSIVTLIAILIGTCSKTLAVNVGDKIKIEDLGDCGYHLQYWDSENSRWSYVKTTMAGFKENGVTHYAYCMNVKLPGVEEGEYSVNINKMLNDKHIYTAIINSFPYKTPKELGVANKYDAFALSKHAIYSVMYDRDVRKYYKGGDERGKKMVNAMEKIVNKARNNPQTLSTSTNIEIKEQGKLKKDTKKGYYSQTYSVSADAEVSKYKVSINNHTKGTIVTDINGKEKKEFASEEKFKILIPKENIRTSKNISINVTGDIKNYPIFYGKAPTGNLQDYALTYSAYSTGKGQQNLNIDKYKSKIKVIKVDKEDNKTRLQGVEIDVLDKDENILESIVTNENGEAVTSDYLICDYQKLYLREKKTQDKYILDTSLKEIQLKGGETINYTFENSKIKGQLEIIKISNEDSKITGIKKGEPIANAKFDVLDENKKYIETITTNEQGIARTSMLEKGIKYVKEKGSPKWYLLNTEEYSGEIVNNGDIIKIKITNTPEKPEVNIEKEGIIQTTANEEIKYDFVIQNTGNTKLDKFTWIDYLPSDYVTPTKLITGTYNQNLNYSIYYKTNKNDYKLLKDNLSTQKNNYIDFTNIKLSDKEKITEFKFEFGTVDVGFQQVDKPQLFVKVKQTVKNDETFTNKTKVEGYNKTYYVFDKDDHTTKVYEKQINVKLPRTGV